DLQGARVSIVPFRDAQANWMLDRMAQMRFLNAAEHDADPLILIARLFVGNAQERKIRQFARAPMSSAAGFDFRRPVAVHSAKLIQALLPALFWNLFHWHRKLLSHARVTRRSGTSRPLRARTAPPAP